MLEVVAKILARVLSSAAILMAVLALIVLYNDYKEGT